MIHPLYLPPKGEPPKENRRDIKLAALMHGELRDMNGRPRRDVTWGV